MIKNLDLENIYIYRSKERKNGTYVIKEVDTIVKEES